MGKTTQTSFKQLTRKSAHHSSTTPKTQPTPASIPADNDPTDLSAANIVQLQHTIGNHAVQRLVQSRNQAVEVKNAAPEATVQRFMGYDELVTAASAELFANKIDLEVEDVLKGKAGAKAHQGERDQKGLTKLTDSNLGIDLHELYFQYQRNPSLTNEMRIYHEIILWKTLNAGRPWQIALEPVLNTVMSEIENDVKAETYKAEGMMSSKGSSGFSMGGLFGKGKDKDKKKGKMDSTSKPEIQMPPILAEAGVPEAWFITTFADAQRAIPYLVNFYVNLKDGNAEEAEANYLKIKGFEGMSFIRSVILSHLPQQARLEGLVGTDEDDTAITDAEMQAVIAYSGGDYEKMNAQLRAHTVKPRKTKVGAPLPRSQARQEVLDRKKIMKLAVSGLNKLPKFTGLAYRVLLWTPAGYMSTIQPGSVVVDLGFVSASPSMTGVGNFRMGEGIRATYFLIHARTAVNISGISSSPKEGEVLFRPGTRFTVKAIWQYVNGKVPRTAPVEAQMVLHAQGEDKALRDKDFNVVGKEKVKVIEVVEV